VTLGALVFGLIATSYYVYGVDVIPESRRYALEFEFFLMLAIVEALRLAFQSANSTVRLCAIGSGGALLLAGMPQLWAYGKQGPGTWRPAPRESTIEYKLGQWLTEQRPEGRIFATGGLRFRLHQWFDLPQVGGGFESGLQNRVPVELAYRIRSGENLGSEDTTTFLKALGTEYVVVHGKGSREYYRDFVRPERLASTPVYRTEDDAVYALPRRSIAHVMREDEVVRNPERLERYVAGRDDPARPMLSVRWPEASSVVVTGAPAGSLVSLQVNADAGWHAFGASIERDALGFIVLRAGGGPIELRYQGTAEQRVFAVVSAMGWLGAAALTFRRRFRRSS